jgi:hypothetical protein
MDNLKVTSKRGDIPVTILVIGVFVVCTAALISFYGASLRIEDSFEGVSLVEKMNIKIEAGSVNREEIEVFKGVEHFYYEITKTSLVRRIVTTVFSVRYPLK